MGPVLRTPVAVLAAVLAVLVAPGIAAAAPKLLVVDAHGRVHARADRWLAPPDPSPARTRVTGPTVRLLPRAARARAAPTVRAALDGLLASGRLDPARHALWRAIYDRATRTLGRLRGERRRELGAVLANVRALAAGGLLTAERSALAFLTLERNRVWWAARPLLRYGQRVSFSRSRLIWQFYPGQGLQVQWLGTFGKANGSGTPRHDDEPAAPARRGRRARRAPRGGRGLGVAASPSTAGVRRGSAALSQGTGIQALSRAAVRLADPRYLGAAQRRARHLPHAAARGRARRHAAGRALPAVLASRRACASSTASSRRSTAWTTSSSSAATPTVRRSSPPASRRRRPRCRPSTPARGRSTRGRAGESSLELPRAPARLPALAVPARSRSPWSSARPPRASRPT